MASELEYDLGDALDVGRKWLVNFSARKAYLVSFHCSNWSGAIDVKIDGSTLDKKSSFKMQGLSFFSNLDMGFYKASY